MPNFTFKCLNKECKNEFDELISFDKIKDVKCPVCNNSAERIYTTGTLLFRDPSGKRRTLSWGKYH